MFLERVHGVPQRLQRRTVLGTARKKAVATPGVRKARTLCTSVGLRDLCVGVFLLVAAKGRPVNSGQALILGAIYD